MRCSIAVAAGNDSERRVSFAQTVEAYPWLLPFQLCPLNVQPISDVAISAGYAAYSGAAGSGRVVRQPHGWSSLSFFARHGTQLLIREQRRKPEGDPKTLRMAHLPRALRDRASTVRVQACECIAELHGDLWHAWGAEARGAWLEGRILELSHNAAFVCVGGAFLHVYGGQAYRDDKQRNGIYRGGASAKPRTPPAFSTLCGGCSGGHSGRSLPPRRRRAPCACAHARAARRRSA